MQGYTREDGVLGRRVRMVLPDLRSASAQARIESLCAAHPLPAGLALRWGADPEAWVAVHDAAEPGLRLDAAAYRRTFGLPPHSGESDPTDHSTWRTLRNRQVFVVERDVAGCLDDDVVEGDGLGGERKERVVATCTAWFGGDEFRHLADRYAHSGVDDRRDPAAAGGSAEDVDATVGRVHWLAVVPRRQRQGIGTALLCAALRHMAAPRARAGLGCAAAALATWSSKANAVALYSMAGFVPYTERSSELDTWGVIAAAQAPRLPALHDTSAQDWQLVGEGGASAVVRYVGTGTCAPLLRRTVLRLRKFPLSSSKSTGEVKSDSASGDLPVTPVELKHWAQAQQERAFIRAVIVPLLQHERYVTAALGRSVALSRAQRALLASWLEARRDEGRRATSAICRDGDRAGNCCSGGSDSDGTTLSTSTGDAQYCCATQLDDATVAPVSTASSPIVVLEIKPKSARRTDSPFVRGARGLRRAVSPFWLKQWRRRAGAAARAPSSCRAAASCGSECSADAAALPRPPWLTDASERTAVLDNTGRSGYDPEDFFAEAVDTHASVASEDSLDAQARAAAGAGCPRLRRALCALLDAPQNNLQLRVRGERIMGLSTRPDGINNACVRKEVGDVLAQAWAVCSEGSLDPATSFCSDADTATRECAIELLLRLSVVVLRRERSLCAAVRAAQEMDSVDTAGAVAALRRGSALLSVPGTEYRRAEKSVMDAGTEAEVESAESCGGRAAGDSSNEGEHKFLELVDACAAMGVPRPPVLPTPCQLPAFARSSSGTNSDEAMCAAALKAIEASHSPASSAARQRAMEWINELPLPGCVELVRAWLLSLVASDCSLIISAQLLLPGPDLIAATIESMKAAPGERPCLVAVSHPTTGAELTFAYRLQVVDVGPKPATKLREHDDAESKTCDAFAMHARASTSGHPVK